MSLDSLLRRAIDLVTDLLPSWLLPRGLPGWPVALALGLVIAAVVGSALGPRVGLPRIRMGVWLCSLLLVPTYTWTIPNTSDRLPSVWQMCEVGYLPWPSLLRLGIQPEIITNVLLLVPAGAAVVLWPLGVPRLAALAVALAVSPVIEAVQLIPELHRGCQVADVVNNSLGVWVGFAAASAVESVWRSLRQAGSV